MLLFNHDRQMIENIFKYTTDMGFSGFMSNNFKTTALANMTCIENISKFISCNLFVYIFFKGNNYVQVI